MKFTSNPGAYEELRRIIEVDTGNRDCFVVGLDNIDKYWQETDGQWTHENDYKTKLSTSSVLKAVGLSESRYEEYKKLFALTDSERVTFCHVRQTTTVLTYRSGLAVSGCIGNIIWRRGDPPPPTGKRGEGDFTEITVLRDGWYLEYECT